MGTYARIVDDVAVEIFIEFGGWSIDECFHPIVRAMFFPVPDGTVVNSTWTGTEWLPPVTPQERAKK